jgi:2-oxoglutarate dehydrogenase E2 component (dihydrolipoamide succinyltransferase)
MPTDIVIPEMGESVRTGVIAAWRKNAGDLVARDEPLLDLETDKITMEIVAPAAGKLARLANEGDEVPVGAVVGRIEEAQGAPAASPAPAAPAPVRANQEETPPPSAGNGRSPATPAPATAAAPAPSASTAAVAATATEVRATPVARKLAEEHGVDLSKITGTGAGGRIREQDVLGYVQSLKAAPTPAAAAPPQPTGPAPRPAAAPVQPMGDRAVRRERMTPLRQRIATRLVEAQHTAAMLTTFNEADMTAVMDLRKRYKESFEKKHGIGLGFMSFFVKACVNALQSFPAVNASIVTSQAGSGGAPEIEYHDYCDIAMAVGTPKGLVVPVLRSCEKRSFADIESGIKDLATRARDGKLSLDDLQGGTFTITNGGIYGSLMSTPILNPPQSGILGMHAIKPRAVEHPAGSGQVAIRPMMYLALSYDHRIIDGAEAVQFLVAVKSAIEEPERLMLGM